MTVGETHKRFFQLIKRHGTAEEIETMMETARLMRLVRVASMHITQREADWGPMEDVILPGFIVTRARRSAAARHERAKKFRLGNQHGVVRSLEAEERVTEAQFAACIMLGIEFGSVPTNHRSAKAHGNLGGNCSAFTPKEGSFGVLIAEDENPRRHVFVIVRTGEHRYECLGWCRAGEMMKDVYRRNWVRGGVPTHPWVGPTSDLLPLRDWFAR